MNRAPARDFVVGLFVLAGLGAIAYLSMNVGGFSLQRDGGLMVHAAFDQTGGIKARAPVVISGVKVGQIDSITLDKNFRARVDMNLERNLQVPVDTSASIVTAGLLGDRYISLQLGGEEKYLKSGDEITMTESAVILERLIGRLIHNTDVQKSE